MKPLNPDPVARAFQPVIDAMRDGVAIMARDGTIRCVNDVWRQFSSDNDGDPDQHYLGGNYLHICRRSADQGDQLAAEVEAGLMRLFADGQDYRVEYPCHSDTEKRWFEMVASSLEFAGERFALITHHNTTSRNLARIELSHAEQSARNLAAIVATMPDAVIAFDLQGRITSWNAAAEKLYGYDRGGMVGQSIEMLYPPDWPRRAADYIAEIVAGELQHFDVTRQTRAGLLRTIAVTAAPVRSASGDIIGASTVHRDVTEERRAEQRLRSILDNLFAFVGVLEPDGTLVEANRAPLDAAGIKAADVIGKKFWDCYWWNYTPEIQNRVQESCERARNGETVRYDVEVRVAGGQLLWIDFQLAPLLDSDGKIVNLIPSGIDISDRKSMMAALKTSHDTFRNMVAGSPFGIYTVDADFRLAHVSDGAQPVFANVRPLIGHDFAEALRIIWPAAFAEEAISLFRHTLETGEPYHSPSTIERRQDSNEIESYDWKIERITMPDGRPGVVCNFYDLSERQRYDEHIRYLMREVNHRSKNLLTVVISMARQTARASPPAEFIDRFSQRLFSLSGSQDLIVQGNWGGVSVRDLVQSQIKHLGDDMQTDRFSIEGPEMVFTPTAAQGIGMALHELSTNALKYGSLSRLGGTVSIDWDTLDEGKVFRIRWHEHGGPPVTLPQESGFGRTVIERMAAISVGGKVDLDYAPTGVKWALIAPVGEVVLTGGAELLKSIGES
ncbi:PAS domain-containing sensor histidine kinase [Hoeflea ulvae]|uniref:Blue-light-activated histidine kinase n=1 Tax=Hoeflea ulvae TaxID=2983764 RepID=A0ABT3YER3_9HYPH|nr:PAS domain-containing protein [Hoeflea ulvae]MCY0094289.1 PAS domain-containing protein [Hoeflea ulvae]